ncbi:MAG: hypothetical protein EOO15_05640 [Chitinophagaceae bacterium]|nr:MAG: hypothetical protein EOO15_05640 [Chitinophagaceae bacterium]
MNIRCAFWLARFDTEEDLINYIEYHHDADGNATSPLDDALGKPGYDEDFLECVYTDADDLAEEVEGFTYSEHYEDQLKERLKALGGNWNTLLMISAAEGDTNEWLFEKELAEQPAEHVKFVGVFDMEEEEE